jgi:hypothetical protein
MDIRVYLNNGDIRDFSQPDPVLEQATLAELNAAKLFASPSLILGSGATCTLLQPAAISRIDIVSTAPLQIPSTFNEQVQIIEDEEVFRLRSKAAAKAFREGIAPGEKYVGYLSFDLAGGHSLMLELQRVLKDQLQFFTNLNRILEIPLMSFPHPRGGAVFLNVRNVVSVVAAPGFAEYPKGALAVELL